jgi:hypothetical protein
VERFENLDEDVLRQVFGLIEPADELVRQVEHLAAMLLDDDRPRDLIAFEAPFDDGVNL